MTRRDLLGSRSALLAVAMTLPGVRAAVAKHDADQHAAAADQLHDEIHEGAVLHASHLRRLIDLTRRSA